MLPLRLELLMSDTIVDLQEILVMRVRADMRGDGPAGAMQLLESKLPTLKGRKFYGCFRITQEGEEYYACVARIESDSPERMRIETGIIPGGKYARLKIMNWEKIIRDGELPRISKEFAESHDADPERFTVEFYRSQHELQLLVPVKSSTNNGPIR